MWLLFLLAAPLAAPAQDISGILLGRETPTPEQLLAADLNEDGVVDAADLWLLLQTETRPTVRFLTTSDRVREEDTVLQVPVAFSTPFTGVLTWEVQGTAVPGVDFNAPQTSMNLNAAISAEIPITLLDDDLISPEIKTIVLSFNPSPQYRLGTNQSHTIYLEDNDSRWAGTFTAGFTTFEFTLETITQGGTTVGTLVSKGDGTFPAGTFQMEDVILTASEFSARIPAIEVPEGSSFARFPLSRSLILQASIDKSDQLVGDDFIQGTAIETIGTSDGQPSHIDSEVEGIFVMARQLQDPGIVTPPLIDATKRQEGAGQ